jgi:hypothetical protein
VASLAQNSTVPVALTPKVECATFDVPLVPADAAVVPIIASTVAAATTTTPACQYFRLMAYPPVAVEDDY